MRLTKRAIDGIKPDATEFVLWDDELRGFGLRVKPTGRKSFLIQYRNRQGRSRRLTVGSYGRLTPDEARREAKRLLAMLIAARTQPNSARTRGRQSQLPIYARNIWARPKTDSLSAARGYPRRPAPSKSIAGGSSGTSYPSSGKNRSGTSPAPM